MNKKKKGFTLIELIVVIAILGILALILSIGMQQYIKKAQTDQCTNIRQQLLRTYQQEEVINPGTTLEVIMKNADSKYYKQNPKCSSGGKLYIMTTPLSIELICTKHGGGIRYGELDLTPIGIQTLVVDQLDKIQKMSREERKAIFGTDFINNDLLRKYIKDKIYGGNWPKLDNYYTETVTGKKDPLYVQICYNNNAVNGSAISDNAIIYASGNQGNSWGAKLIYDPNEKVWYAADPSVDKGDIMVMNQPWSTVKDEMARRGWKPVK